MAAGAEEINRRGAARDKGAKKRLREGGHEARKRATRPGFRGEAVPPPAGEGMAREELKAGKYARVYRLPVVNGKVNCSREHGMWRYFYSRNFKKSLNFTIFLVYKLWGPAVVPRVEWRPCCSLKYVILCKYSNNQFLWL